MPLSKSIRKRLAVQVQGVPESTDPHPCIACGRTIRWALKSCFECNRVLVNVGQLVGPRRFINFG